MNSLTYITGAIESALLSGGFLIGILWDKESQHKAISWLVACTLANSLAMALSEAQTLMTFEKAVKLIIVLIALNRLMPVLGAASRMLYSGPTTRPGMLDSLEQ